MRRLYLKIYLTIIASLIIILLAAGAAWRLSAEQRVTEPGFAMAGELVAAILPDRGAPSAEQSAALNRLAARLKLDLALFESGGSQIAGAGRALPSLPASPHPGWARTAGGGPLWTLQLPDGRWLMVRPPPRARHPALGLVLLLAGIAVIVALAAYPAARGLTRRLERLQAGVEKLGSGHLAARVKVEGRDEVARLAESFNDAAARIEALVGAHRMLLANASHELRTPLSRIRLGVELLKAQADPKRKAELEADIGELDNLIDEILLASRLEAGAAEQAREEIDLLALAAEECARYPEAKLDGVRVTVRGDPRLLRRMVRNLLENARRHGNPPVEVRLARLPAGACLTVSDHGTGVPPGEREHIFQPFRRVPGAAESTGAGLGLSLVRQIAQRHGGDAIVAATSSGRTAFQVTLPASL